MVGILADKDRIFLNIYGVHDWGLEGARLRGAWNGTKDIVAQTPEYRVSSLNDIGNTPVGTATASTERPA